MYILIGLPLSAERRLAPLNTMNVDSASGCHVTKASDLMSYEKFSALYKYSRVGENGGEIGCRLRPEPRVKSLRSIQDKRRGVLRRFRLLGLQHRTTQPPSPPG